MNTKAWLLTLLCLVSVGPAAKASLLFNVSSAIAGNGATSPSESLGFEFTTSVQITVTALGFYDYTGTLSGTPAVGLYTTGGALLVSTNVLNTDPTVDSFNFDSVTPYVLPAGTYVLAAVTGSNAFIWNPNGFVFDPESAAGPATFIEDLYTVSNSLVFPTTTDGPGFDGLFGPNLEFQGVPEPATAGLLGFGLVALGLASRLKRKAR